jgi:hypothetical protein
MRTLQLVLTILAVTAVTGGAAHAAGDNDGIADRNAPSNFDRTHQAIDRTMNTGNDRSPPLGQGKGERSGLGGLGGGADPRGPNGAAINEK